MLVSMTGFGRAEVILSPGAQAIIEISTLNHKFLEVDCRLPEGFQGLEDQIRGLIGKQVRRGRVRVSVSVKMKDSAMPVVFDAELARRYVGELRKFQKRLRVPGELSMEMVLGLPRVVSAPERDMSAERWWPKLQEGVAEALTGLAKMRQKEGGRLRSELARIAGAIERTKRSIERRIPSSQKQLEKRLAARIEALAKSAPSVQAARSAVIAEAAGLVQSNDVTEELARIDSHLKALRQAFAGQVENPGRTMDFLAQELHREVNTLGVKARDARIVRWAIDLKGQIEKLREQAANVE